MRRTWHLGVRWAWAVVAAVVPATGLLQAAPGPQSPPHEAARPKDESQRQLVRQLDADTLQLRQQASEQLLADGRGAIGPLVAALPHASAETTMRGLAILKKLSQSADMETKRDARAALEQLARSDDRSLATQAATILKAQDPLARSTFRIGGQAAGRPGGFHVFQVQMFNGPTTRRVVARENGRTVAITESPEAGIVISITDRVKDRDQTTTIVAATPGELEVKNPQAAALYRKYLAGANAGIPGGNPLVAPGGVIPPQPFRRFEQPKPAPPAQKP